MKAVLLLCALVLTQGLSAQDASRITLDRLYGSRDFAAERFGPARWLKDGSGYTTLERSGKGPGQDIVRYDPLSGSRDILVQAKQLIPKGRTKPLSIADYIWSADG